MVEVTREPKEFDKCRVLEHCVICDMPTKYWYTPYNQPLCQDCAKEVEVKDIPKNIYFPGLTSKKK